MTGKHRTTKAINRMRKVPREQRGVLWQGRMDKLLIRISRLVKRRAA